MFLGGVDKYTVQFNVSFSLDPFDFNDFFGQSNFNNEIYVFSEWTSWLFGRLRWVIYETISISVDISENNTNNADA